MIKTEKAFSGFSVDDIEAAKKFYTSILGVDAEEGEMGNLILHLSDNNHILIYRKPNHEPASFTVLNFPVDDIESTVKRLAGKGIEFEQYDGDLQTDEKGIFRGGGPLIAWFKDPAGNILSLIEEQH